MKNDLFHKAVHMVSSVMRQVEASDLNNPTPCSEWNVRELIQHILNETAWVEPLVKGKTISEVGDIYEGDLVGDSVYESWRGYAEAATSAAETADTEAVAHLSYTDKPVSSYLDEVGGDLMVHGWDLAKAIGVDYEIDEDSARKIRENTKDMMVDARQSGLFKQAESVSQDASESEKLLAAFGRDSEWKP